MFLPIHDRIVPGIGNPEAKICIIGEAPGAEEDRVLRPFAGASGTVLDHCLHAAGLTRQDCYITNTIKVKPKNNDIAPFYNARTGTFTASGTGWLDSLREELSNIHSNTIVTLGAVAMAAVTGLRSPTKYRGYVTQTSAQYGSRKVIPTYHPAATLRGQYILRYYITADLRKAKSESAFPEIRRPVRQIVMPESIQECRDWIDKIQQVPEYVCDIEVENFEVSAISFAISPSVSISFTVGRSAWTEQEEFELWQMLHTVLTNGAKKIFQNGIFDVAFLMTQCGIHIPMNIVEDTMIAHHIMYPDMLKGLGFLGSLYCGAQEYWKDMVKFDNIKDES